MLQIGLSAHAELVHRVLNSSGSELSVPELVGCTGLDHEVVLEAAEELVEHGISRLTGTGDRKQICNI